MTDRFREVLVGEVTDTDVLRARIAVKASSER
jgi:hypothetical protein